MVSEPMKPWLDPDHCLWKFACLRKSDGARRVSDGASLDPYDYIPRAQHWILPRDSLRACWNCFSSPRQSSAPVADGRHDSDFAPIMGTPINGFYLDGLGTGVLATPVCGKTMAYTVANDRNHDLIKDFSLFRFVNHAPVVRRVLLQWGINNETHDLSNQRFTTDLRVCLQAKPPDA